MLHIFSLRNLALCLRTRAEDSENTDHEHERGSAIVEFLGLGVTLLLPIMYGVLTIFSVQASILGAHAASAQVAQYIQELPPETSMSQEQAQRLSALVARDFGVAESDISVSLSCSGSCSARESIRVQVQVNAHLPLIPQGLGASVIPVSSQSVTWGHAEIGSAASSAFRETP